MELKYNVKYHFGYYDENNFYIYEIESRDDKQFKLVDSDKHDMTKRLEYYLNDGSFEKAEMERMSGSRPFSHHQSSSTSVIGGADQPTDIVVKSDVNVWLIVAIGALILLLVIELIIKERK